MAIWSALRGCPGRGLLAFAIGAASFASACSSASPAARWPQTTAPSPAAAQDSAVTPGPTGSSWAAPDEQVFLAAVAKGAAVVAHTEPSGDAAELLRLANPLASGAPLTFLVLATVEGWYQVQLPVRPNGTTAWIRAADVTTETLSYRVEVELGAKQVTVYSGDQVVLRAPVGVGAEPNPTPGGTFYLLELIEPPDPGGSYGPLAFGLSGFSETLTSFAGGDGRLGLHGTNDPASLGSAVSHGCIRVSNDTILELAALLPLGTPITILG